MRAVIDTSFWIDYGRGAVTPAERERVERLWRQGGGVMHQFVWLELTVGFRSPKEQSVLREFRRISQWEPLVAEDGEKAEEFAAILRKNGRTVGASDLLILAAADRIHAQIVHHDSDFDRALELPEFAHLRLQTPTGKTSK